MEKIGLGVRLEDGKFLLGSVVDVDHAGDSATVDAEFPRCSSTPVRIGMRVSLLLTDSTASASRPLEARVLSQIREEAADRLQLEVDEHAGRLLSPAFNRRRYLRVRPSAALPVEVRLGPRDGEYLASPAVEDLSTGGVGVLLNPEEERSLFAFWDVRLELQTFDGDPPMEFAGSVRARRLKGTSILYGIEFDAGATQGFAQKEKRVQAYVVLRQMAMLRGLRESR